MENAKNLKSIKHHRILAVGEIGTGKSTQFLTIPGKKFAYIFDPNALATFAGWDIDYETFFPLAGELDFYPSSIKKDKKQFSDSKGRSFEPVTYLRWAEEVNKKMEAGFFDDYDALSIDGLTMFSASVMDRTIWLQNKVERDDERTDYRLAGDKVSNAIRALTDLKITFFCTAHTEFFQDDKTKRLTNRIMLPGGSRVRVPTIFTNVFVMHGEFDEGEKYRYTIQTKPNRENPIARTSIPGLGFEEDVTIPEDVLLAKDSKEITKYGVGALLEGRKTVKGE